MNKTEVYSWRLDPDLKQRLESAARDEKTSIGGLLDRIAREWLGRHRPDEDDEEEQLRLHSEARKWIGSISSGDPYGSEQVKERVRKYVEQKHLRRAARSAD
jgi:hypothetical protein